MAPNPTLQVDQRGAVAGGARGDDAVLPFAVSVASGIVGGLLVGVVMGHGLSGLFTVQ